MKNIHKNKLLANLACIALLTISQAHAETIMQQKGTTIKTKPVVSIPQSKVKAKSVIQTQKMIPIKNSRTPTKTNNSLEQSRVGTVGGQPKSPGVPPQSPFGRSLAENGIDKQKNNLNRIKELNGFQSFNPTTNGRALPTPADGFGRGFPGRQGKSSKGLFGRGTTNAAGEAGVIRDHRGGVTTFESVETGDKYLFPTPEGGTHHSPGSDGSFAELHRDGDMYVLEAEGAMSFFLEEDVQRDTGSSSSNDSSTNNNNDHKGSSGSGGKEGNDNDSNDSSDNNESDDSKESDDSDNEGDSTTGEDSDDGSSGGEEGANENTNGGGNGDNTLSDSSKVSCAANPFDAACKEDGSTKTKPCENNGSGRVAQPGPEGEANCVPGNLGGSDEDDEENSPPSVEDNLPVNTGMTAEDRRNMVINPAGVEGRMDDRNQALETLGGIEGVINPADPD